jgi:hypothetical protein
VFNACVKIIDFVQGHVSAIAAQFLQQPPSSGAFLDGGDHLKELVPNAKEGIVKPKEPHPWVPVDHVDVEGRRDVCNGLVEAVGNKGNLA